MSKELKAIMLNRKIGNGKYIPLLDACGYYVQTRGWTGSNTLAEMAKESKLFKQWLRHCEAETANGKSKGRRSKGIAPTTRGQCSGRD